MKKYKIGLGLLFGFTAAMPFVAADIKMGPTSFIMPILGLVIVGGFIMMSVFLVRWIIKKIKNS